MFRVGDDDEGMFRGSRGRFEVVPGQVEKENTGLESMEAYWGSKRVPLSKVVEEGTPIARRRSLESSVGDMLSPSVYSNLDDTSSELASIASSSKDGVFQPSLHKRTDGVPVSIAKSSTVFSIPGSTDTTKTSKSTWGNRDKRKSLSLQSVSEFSNTDQLSPSVYSVATDTTRDKGEFERLKTKLSSSSSLRKDASKSILKTSKSFKSRLPETPGNGVTFDNEVLLSSDGGGNASKKMKLAVVPKKLHFSPVSMKDSVDFEAGNDDYPSFLEGETDDEENMALAGNMPERKVTPIRKMAKVPQVEVTPRYVLDDTEQGGCPTAEGKSKTRIIEPCFDPKKVSQTPGVRRSKRRRWLPLQGWRGERLIMQRHEGPFGAVEEVVGAGKPSTFITPNPPRKKRSTRKPVKVASSESEEGGDDDAEARIAALLPKDVRISTPDVAVACEDAITLDTVNHIVIRDHDDVDMTDLPGDDSFEFVLPNSKIPQAASNPRGGAAFETSRFISGVVELPPLGVKPMENAAAYTQVFFVTASEKSSLCVTLNSTTYLLSKGDQFWVPANTNYRLANYSQRKTVSISFVLIKP